MTMLVMMAMMAMMAMLVMMAMICRSKAGRAAACRTLPWPNGLHYQAALAQMSPRFSWFGYPHLLLLRPKLFRLRLSRISVLHRPIV